MVARKSTIFISLIVFINTDCVELVPTENVTRPVMVHPLFTGKGSIVAWASFIRSSCCGKKKEATHGDELKYKQRRSGRHNTTKIGVSVDNSSWNSPEALATAPRKVKAVDSFMMR